MHILVTGGAGYVGTQVVALLLERGHHVRVMDAMLYGSESLLPFISHAKFSYVKGDVRCPEDWAKALSGIDAVVHLAAVVGEPACKIVPAFSWSTNHDALPAVMASCQGRVKRFIYASTCSNYGVSAPNVEVDETAGLNPLSDYARAKVVGESVVMGSTMPHVTVLRFATVCGIAARMRFDLLVNEMARETARGRVLQIFSPQAWRPYLHVHDAARAIAAVLEAEPLPAHRGIFNVVAENMRKCDLLDMARAYDASVKDNIIEKQADLRDYRVSGKRFQDTFGFSCRYRVAEAFREVADAVKAGVFRDADEPRHTATAINLAAAA